MPKAVTAASGRVLGGYGPERKEGAFTPTGRNRSAERWSSPAAIALQQQLHFNFKKSAKGSFRFFAQYVSHVLTSPSELQAVLSGEAVKVYPPRDQLLARAIMEKYSAKAAQDSNNVATVSKYAIARI